MKYHKLLASGLAIGGLAACVGGTSSTSSQPPATAPSLTFGNGVNLQPSYYNGGNVNFGWSLMQSESKIKTVRIEVEPRVPISLASSWINQAANAGYSIIVTYHDYTKLGSDNPADLMTAANWWQSNYATLHQAGDFTINLMNEWGDHNLTATQYATAYNAAISVVRNVYSGQIIIDLPGWGQEPEVAANAVLGKGTSDGVKINDSNIILSAHIYPSAWDNYVNHALENSDLDALTAAGRPCMVGEFGSIASSGNADWSGLVDHAKSLGWPVLGWAWNGDGGEMNMMAPAWKNNPQPEESQISISSYFAPIYAKL